MPKKILSVIGWGVAGLVVALGLTAGAFALAGQNLDEPLEPPVFPVTSQRTGAPTPDDEGSGSPQVDRSDSPSPSVDDHGGDEDNSGQGSEGDGSDNSGSGSDNSGSGSDNSGSGSDNSGSGSGDDHDDD